MDKELVRQIWLDGWCSGAGLQAEVDPEDPPSPEQWQAAKESYWESFWEHLNDSSK